MKVIRSFREMDFDKLAGVYDLETAESFDKARDLYDYLREIFFRTEGAVYFILEQGNEYLSALRAEPFGDGYLIEALQTKLMFRNMGLANRLLRSVIHSDEIPKGLPLYAHIHKKNHASIAVHKACGFHEYLDYASFIDGTVSSKSSTWIINR